MFPEIKDPQILQIIKFLHIKNKKILNWIGVFELFSDRTEKNHIFMMAAGVAFNIILYLMPLFLVAVYIVNILFDIDTLSNTIEQIFLNFLPPSQSNTATLKEVLHEVNFIMEHSSLAGWIGIIILLWLSSTLIGSFRVAINSIFNIHAPQIFIIYRLRDILLTIVLAILLFASTYIFPVVSFFQDKLLQHVPQSVNWIFSTSILTGITLTTYFIMFYLMFKFIPTKKVARKIRLIATGLSVVLLELSRFFFAWYMTTISSYGKFYGTYAILAIAGLWIYYLVLVILFSALIAKIYYDLRILGKYSE